MPQELWNEKKSHIATKRQLMQTQMQLLQLMAQQLDTEDAALGAKWVEPVPEPVPEPVLAAE